METGSTGPLHAPPPCFLCPTRSSVAPSLEDRDRLMSIGETRRSKSRHFTASRGRISPRPPNSLLYYRHFVTRITTSSHLHQGRVPTGRSRGGSRVLSMSKVGFRNSTKDVFLEFFLVGATECGH